jgi:hypothetical protein
VQLNFREFSLADSLRALFQKKGNQKTEITCAFTPASRKTKATRLTFSGLVAKSGLCRQSKAPMRLSTYSVFIQRVPFALDSRNEYTGIL